MTETEVQLAGPTECFTFEPQAWRKTICKNCFQPPEKHAIVADLESSGDGSVFSKSVSRQNSSEPVTPEAVGKLVDGFKSEFRSSLSPDKKAVSIKEKYEQLERDKFQPKEFSNTLPRTKYKKGISSNAEKYDTVESLSGTDNIKTNIPPPTLPKQYKKMSESGSEISNLLRSKFGSVENILDNDNGEFVNTKQKINKFGSMENICVQDNRKEPQKTLPKSNFDGTFENSPEGNKTRASDVKPFDKKRDILNKLDEFTNEVKSCVTSKIGQTIINKQKNENVNVIAIETKQTDDKQYCDNNEKKLRQSSDITPFKSEVEVADSKPACIDTNAKLKHDPHSKFELKLSMPENEKQSSLRQSKEKLLSPMISSHAIKTVPDTMSNISKDKLNTEANHNHISVNDTDKNAVLLKYRSQSSTDAGNTGSDKDTYRPNEINAHSKTSMPILRDIIKSPTPEKDGNITWKLKHQLKTPSPETEKKPDFKLKIQLSQSIPEVPLSVVDKEDAIKTLKRCENVELISPKLEINKIPIFQQTNQPKSPTKEADKRLELQTKEQSKLSSLVSPDIDKNSNLTFKDQTKSKSNLLTEGKRIGVNFKDQLSSFGKSKLESSKWEKSSVNHSKQDAVITDNESKGADYLSKSKNLSEESKSIKINQNKEEERVQSTGEQQVLQTPKEDAEKENTSKYSKSTLDTKKEKDKGALNTKEKDELTAQIKSTTTGLKSNKNKNGNDLTPMVEKSLLVPNKEDKSFGLRSNIRGVKEHGRKDSENVSTKSKFELPSLKSSKSEPNDAKTLRTRAQCNITDSKDESKVKGNKFKSGKCEMKETRVDTQGGLAVSDKNEIPKLQYGVSGDNNSEAKTNFSDIIKPSMSASISDQNQVKLNINDAKPNECMLNKSTMNTADNTLEKYTYINGDTSSQTPKPDTGQNIETEIKATSVDYYHDFPTNDSDFSENETFGSKDTDTLKRKNVRASGKIEPNFDTISTNVENDVSSTSQETCADKNANENLPLYVDTQVFTRSRNKITEDYVLTNNYADTTYDNLSTGSGTGFSSTRSSFETKREESENVPNGDISDELQQEKFNVQIKTLDSDRKINMGLSESGIEKLKSELLNMTERCQNLETENEMLRKDLSKTEVSAADLRKHMDEVDLTIKGLHCQLNSSDDRCIKLESENINLKNNIKTSQMKLQTKEADEMDERLSTREKLMDDMMEENEQLKQEITELKAEMEEMYDTFRDQEAEEFREIQKELEYTAKNCRILQFKMRKLERQCHQLEQDKKQAEDRLRSLQNQFQDRDAVAHIHLLEDELRMAKDVSVRLRDDLDLMEDKISKVDEENHHLTELLEQSDRKQFRLELEVDKLRDKIIELRTELRARNEADDGEPRKLNCAEFLALHRVDML